MQQTGKISVLALIACPCAQMFQVDAHAACGDNIKRSTPNTDFEFLGLGAVVRHQKTALEWRRCPERMRFIPRKELLNDWRTI